MAARKKRRSSGTGSIFKDKYGYFNAQICVGYQPDGKPKIARKRSKVESEVVAWLKAQTVNQAHGITIASEKLTVEQFLTAWLDTIARSNRYTTPQRLCPDLPGSHFSAYRAHSARAPQCQPGAAHHRRP
jgi:hypothetical protein